MTILTYVYDSDDAKQEQKSRGFTTGKKEKLIDLPQIIINRVSHSVSIFDFLTAFVFFYVIAMRACLLCFD